MSLTGSLLLVPDGELLRQLLLQSVAVLLLTPQLCLQLVAPQLQTGALASKTDACMY